jgi:hypothetical protein
MSQIDGIMKQCLAEAEYYASMRVALDLAVRSLQKMYGVEKQINEAHRAIAHALFEKENNAYRKYFMFALGSTKEAQNEARQMAYERYMRDGMAVTEYLYDRADCLPNVWQEVDEEKFREDLERFKEEIE